MYSSSTVIVIGKNYSTSLGVIRALGAAGYRCIVIQASRTRQKIKTPDLFSRYVEKYFLAFGDCEEKVLRILDSLSEGGKKLIIPIDDYSAFILDKNYETLSEHFLLPSVNRTGGALNDLMGKNRQKELAARCGLNIARSSLLERGADKRFSLPPGLVYPCFVKPNVSAATNKNGIRKCDSPEDLRHVLDSFSGSVSSVLAEEFLEIENEYVLCGLALAGERVIIPGIFKKTKTGEGSLKGITLKGIPVYGEKYDRLLGQLENMISETGLTGLFDIEVIEANGRFYFNELNLRNGAAGYGVTVNGINLPGIYADDVIKGIRPDDDCRMISENDFVSEKAEMDGFAGRTITFREMRKDIRSAKARFMKVPGDVKPYLHFLKFSLVKILKKRVLSD